MAVYFVIAGPYMKIGYSASPIARMETVTISGRRPDDLPRGAEVDIIGWIPGDRWDETRLHAQFESTRVAGEWFMADRDAALKVIQDNPCGVDFHGMSGLAVLTMYRYPELTRDDLRAAGVSIEAKPFDPHSFPSLGGGAA